VTFISKGSCDECNGAILYVSVPFRWRCLDCGKSDGGLSQLTTKFKRMKDGLLYVGGEEAL